MVEKKPSRKKAPVKKATATDKPPVKKATAKKAATKKASIKKSVTKKPTSTVDSKKTSLATGTTDSSVFNSEALATIQSIVKEMQAEQKSRDMQITSLVKEMQKGFSTHSNLSSEQEDRSQRILQSLTSTIMQDHEQTLKEVHEQEKLHDKKFEHLTRVEEHRAGRNKWIAIPGTILAVIGIIYMFHVVNIMEDAMTSMSSDMGKMQLAVTTMTQKVTTMSQDTHSMNNSMVELNSSVGKMGKDTHSMNSNMTVLSTDIGSMSGDMEKLNGNVTVMSRDLNVLTYNVAPTMKGMRDMMPWSP